MTETKVFSEGRQCRALQDRLAITLQFGQMGDERQELVNTPDQWL